MGEFFAWFVFLMIIGGTLYYVVTNSNQKAARSPWEPASFSTTPGRLQKNAVTVPPDSRLVLI
jgi:hypothetical protein